MTTRYRCPISTCRWFHDAVATPPVPYCPPDILAWSVPTWASMSERIDGGLAAAHIIDGHLVTHSPVQWMAELLRLRTRAEDAELANAGMAGALKLARDLIDAMDPLTTRRMPTRAEVEATREALAGAVSGGGIDA